MDKEKENEVNMPENQENVENTQNNTEVNSENTEPKVEKVVEEKVEEKVEQPVETTNTNSNASTEQKQEEQPKYTPLGQEQTAAPKKSNTGLIIAIVILVVIVVGLLCAVLYMFTRDKVSTVLGDGLNEVTTIVDDTANIIESEAPDINALLGGVTNTIGTDTTVEPSTGASTSSLENPLQVGEWGIASKYNPSNGEYQNVNVRVTNIIRGDEAKKMAQEYMSSDYSIYRYEDPEAYQEWAVIEYDVDFGDTYEMDEELGASPNVDGDICGPDGSSIEYNGIIYIPSVIEIGSRDYIKTKTGSGKLLTQLPIGCTDYIIQFGAYNETNAYFQGK